MASRKRKYASIEEIEETHQLFDEEESAGDRKRRKNRLNSALYRFRQRSARVDGNVHVRGSSGPPRSLIEQLLSPEVAPSADTAPVCVTETSHDPSADHVVQQALLARRTFRDSVTSTKLNKLAGGAQPCPLRRKNTPSGSVPEELNNLSVSATAPVKKSAEQVKHRKNGKHGKSAIGFITDDYCKRKPQNNGKHGKGATVLVTKKVAPWFHPRSVRRSRRSYTFTRDRTRL
ncbi:hypothetical protein PC121_g13337 [Phytophthora cactorum]|nr:hypothetical protein PC121_g13337 [Phytophthora cactorum]